MRVAIDYTSALTQTGGVGRYTRSLVTALVEFHGPASLLLWSGRTAEGGRNLQGHSPAKVTTLPLPERWLTAGWQRLRLPVPVDRFIEPFDVLHCPDFVAAPSDRPTVITIHDLSYLKVPEYAHPNLARYLTRAVPRAVERASAVIAVSQAIAGDIAAAYPAALGKIVTIPHGVDPIFRQQASAKVAAVLDQIGLRSPYVTIVGTVEPRKNHLGVLQAFERVHAVRPDLSLLIAGRPGWLSDDIMAAIREASATLPIIHRADLSDDQLTAAVAGSLALIYPSWYEGFGLPVAEAMACGTAVITSHGGALEEVAGDAALLVDPASVEGMAEAMIRLYDDPALRQRLVERGISRVQSLTWERAATAHWHVYQEVAGR